MQNDKSTDEILRHQLNDSYCVSLGLSKYLDSGEGSAAERQVAEDIFVGYILSGEIEVNWVVGVESFVDGECKLKIDCQSFRE